MDVIVVPANESLFMTAPAAAAVKRVAGESVEVEAIAAGPIPPGSVTVTGGGMLATPFIIHAVAVGHDLRGDRHRLEATFEAALHRSETLGATRIALPLLGTEHGAVVPEEAAAVLVGALEKHATRPSRTLDTVVIVAASAHEMTAIGQALARTGSIIG
jgi:O-acetyl-ADP-ribose deacetylase (regulator of RNase III)